MDFKVLLSNPEYRFLHQHPDLKDKILLLSVGGSYSYGTNNEESDVDLRGIAYNRNIDLLGVSNKPFEQHVDMNTDTTIYSLNKIIKLLLSCNPNTIEMLGCRPEHYLCLNDDGKLLLENKKIFLSKKAIASFGGYAGQQLNRMLNALARDSYSQKEKEKHILTSVKNAMYSFNERYSDFKDGSMRVYIGESQKEGIDTEIRADICLENYPLRDFNGLTSELVSVVRNYDKCNHRNSKKDDKHLNKHAMHLVRLYFTCFDILEKGEINTYREKEHKLLIEIRNGKFQKSDHSYTTDFFDLVEKLNKRFLYASKNTVLPDSPDIHAINELLCAINRKRIEQSFLTEK